MDLGRTCEHCCASTSHFKVRTRAAPWVLHVCKNCAPKYFYPKLAGFCDANTGTQTVAAQPVITGGCRTIGVEVEGNWHPEDALGFNLNEMISVKNDGSLRGADALELVSPIMQSDTIRDWYVGLHVERMRTYNRSGEHWWFGTDDMAVLDINKLLFYCTMHQHEFASFVPVSRTPQSKFDHSGRPMLIAWEPRIYSSKDGFIRSLYGQSTAEMLTAKMDSEGNRLPKYRLSKRANDKDVTYPGPIHRAWWLNIHSYFFTGGKAIEVRLKHSCRNPVAGIAWLDLWLAVLEAVKRMSLTELKTVSVYEIAPALACEILLDVKLEGNGKSEKCLGSKEVMAIWKNSKTYQEA